MALKPSASLRPSPATVPKLKSPALSRTKRYHVSCRSQTTVEAGPKDPVPDYNNIDSQPLNQLVMGLFRKKMVLAIGDDVPEQGYDGIISLTRKLNSKFGDSRETQVRTVGILNSLFPSWLPRLFKLLISNPFPEFACRMNAWATALTCQWLMGPCKVNDVEVDGGKVAKGQGVLVERCRYLEQSGCASICINSCKVPTQEFFIKDMGLQLCMTPNYEDFSCQFSFGKSPEAQGVDAAFQTPCFSQCPSKRRLVPTQDTTAAARCGGISPL
eukprot:CAMPEP_0202891232 /NCGR_PEP_ID=MMETSP1392-20130828/1348_1 /ASSEMBLY_ACC=CAM_ASM_000868 /TAXON_ID=225041 /ORGANISM="Chlamydomonas chlamydogama, Strain SAG 11-48b" /LENGTH=270 /DNA_ID=CAMNT_0049574923 /DNA_START=47 /DNA_END=859 /DNA_ORIENTATION=+